MADHETVEETDHAVTPTKRLTRPMIAVIALRAKGFTKDEIAKKLGYSPWRLKRLIHQMRDEQGWSYVDRQLQDDAVPLAMENMLKHLAHEGTPLGVVGGHHVVTLATLKGTGLLKQHTAVKQESESVSTHILRVEIALPHGETGTRVDGVLATPRRALPPAIDAELV